MSSTDWKPLYQYWYVVKNNYGRVLWSTLSKEFADKTIKENPTWSYEVIREVL